MVPTRPRTTYRTRRRRAPNPRFGNDARFSAAACRPILGIGFLVVVVVVRDTSRPAEDDGRRSCVRVRYPPGQTSDDGWRPRIRIDREGSGAVIRALVLIDDVEWRHPPRQAQGDGWRTRTRCPVEARVVERRHPSGPPQDDGRGARPRIRGQATRCQQAAPDVVDDIRHTSRQTQDAGRCTEAAQRGTRQSPHVRSTRVRPGRVQRYPAAVWIGKHARHATRATSPFACRTGSVVVVD